MKTERNLVSLASEEEDVTLQEIVDAFFLRDDEGKKRQKKWKQWPLGLMPQQSWQLLHDHPNQSPARRRRP